MVFFKFTILVLLLITPASSLYAKMYKSVDQQGKITYSNITPSSSAQQVTTRELISEKGLNLGEVVGNK